jgi:protease-4
VKGLYDKHGIQEDTLTRGKMADIDSETIPLSDAAKQKLHEAIESTYRAFVTKVAAARKKTYAQIDPLAQGRVWMGAQAHDNGLVDELGGLDEAVSLIRKRANLSPSGATNLVLYPPRRTLLEILTESSPDAFESAAAEARIRKALPGLPDTTLLKGGLLRILPYRLIVH